MLNSSYVNPQRIEISQIQSPLKTFRKSAEQGKIVQIDFLSKGIYKVEPIHIRQPLSSQHDHLKEYVDDYKKDTLRYQQFKSVQKARFFYKSQKNKQTTQKNKNSFFQQLQNSPLNQLQVKINRLVKTQNLASKKQKSLQLHNSNKRYTPRLEQLSNSLQRPPILSPYISRLQSPNSNLQISGQFNRLLEDSKDFRVNKKQLAKKRERITTRSQVYKKDLNMLKQQRASILKIIQKQDQMNPFPKVKDITPLATEKFNLNFLKYQEIKTRKRIQRQYFDRKIRRNISPLQKFQDFIIKQVKFTNKQHKQKLQNFYSHMRQQFKKIQAHKC